MCSLSGVGILTFYGEAIWVANWTGANEKSPNQQLGFYLGVYAVFVVLANLGPYMECCIFLIKVINHTALKLHADLLDATLGQADAISNILALLTSGLQGTVLLLPEDGCWYHHQ